MSTMPQFESLNALVDEGFYRYSDEVENGMRHTRILMKRSQTPKVLMTGSTCYGIKELEVRDIKRYLLRLKALRRIGRAQHDK